MTFCDECGAQYLRASSKWCSECGASRRQEAAKASDEAVANACRNELEEIAEEFLILHLWSLPVVPNLTLYDRVYGQRVKGLPRDIAWGKSFLKQHHCYKKQHMKLKRNQEIVRGWFLPGKNAFVDEFLRSPSESPSLRWNQNFLKKLRNYCREMRSSGDIDERIDDIKFREDGTKLCWRGSDIVKYALEIKHFRKSPRSNPRRQRLTREDPSPETLAIVPACISFLGREERASSEEAVPISPPRRNAEAVRSGEGVSRKVEPRRRRLPAKLRDT